MLRIPHVINIYSKGIIFEGRMLRIPHIVNIY